MQESESTRGRVCVIPARGGSQRIPRKNLRAFSGIPIIHHAINAALDSNCFEEVMVSTEDEEIARESIQAGAVVPFMRSIDTASNYATLGEVWVEVIQEYKKRGCMFSMVCSILPTAVFVTPQTIKDILQLLENRPEWDGVMPVVPYSPPIQRAMFVKNGTLHAVSPEYSAARSQDLEPRYFDAGQLYAFRPDFMMEARSLRKGKVGPFPLRASQVQDIDTEEEWRMAEQKYSCFRGMMG